MLLINDLIAAGGAQPIVGSPSMSIREWRPASLAEYRFVGKTTLLSVTTGFVPIERGVIVTAG